VSTQVSHTTDAVLRAGGAPPAQPWSTYADSFGLVIRETDSAGDAPYERAVAADFTEIGVYLPLAAEEAHLDRLSLHRSDGC
jgi:hypothetical protein